MKSKGILITVIVLLSVWAILATITAIDNENRREKLFEENKSLEQNYEDMLDLEKENMKEGYEKIIDVYKERNKELYDLYLKGIAYEMQYDLSTSIVLGEEWDFYEALDEIAIREELDAWDKLAISNYFSEITEETLNKKNE